MIVSRIGGAFAAAMAVTAFAAPAAAESMVRAPYLQMAGPTSVIVVWTTDVPADSLVRYGSSPSALTTSVASAAAVTQHEVALAGLTPATRYYYAVGSAANPALEGGDVTHVIDTAPPPGTKKKLRAWVVGDSGTGDSNQAGVRDAMLAYVGNNPLDLFLHVGDIAYTAGTVAQFTTNFFRMYPTILRHVPFWPTLGNHEGYSSSSVTQTGPYYDAYLLPTAGQVGGLPSGTEAYYSFDNANVHFVSINSFDIPNKPGDPMLVWLAADLAATPQEWVVAFLHHAPYSKGTHDSDTESWMIAMRQNVVPVLEAGGVDLVLTGHSHDYERSFLIDHAYDTPTTAGHIKDTSDGKPLGSGPYLKPPGKTPHHGAVYVVAGHGGGSMGGTLDHPLMYFSEAVHGSCILDVQENRLSLTNLRTTGVVSDHFVILKGDGIVVTAPDGGEQLTGGSSFDLRWTTVGNASSVKLEYSLDGGATFSTIVGSAPNTGTYTWAVPAVDTLRALVRVSDAAAPQMRDESNAVFAITSTAPVPAITYGEDWKYNDTGTDLGPVWFNGEYDDNGWPSGPGQLGYGEGDETSLLAEAPVWPSYYFRKTITLNAPVVSANLRVLHDDGVAVWINGVPVFSKHLDNGTSFGAWASALASENEVDHAAVPMSPSPFLVGPNVIAAMVKQVSATSSDISFDLELDVVTETASSSSSSSSSSSGAGGAGGTGGSSTGTGGTGGSSTGTGGTGGSSTGTGGTGGSSTGTGGTGTGGSTAAGGAGGAGAAGSGGTTSASSGPSNGEQQGCGCEVPGARETRTGATALAALPLVLAARRRRRATARR